MSDINNTKGFIPDKEYEIIMKYMPVSTADNYFTNSNKELLLAMRTNKPAQGIEFVQGGRVHKGETRIQAAIRKAHEELGLVLDASRFTEFGTFDDFFDDSSFKDENGKDIPAHTISTCFACELTNDEIEQIKLDTQHSSKRFVHPEEDDTLHPYIQQRRQVLKKKMGY